jgi:Protein of unknown function (DUF5818)
VLGKFKLCSLGSILLLLIGFACIGSVRAGETKEAMKTFEGTLQTGIIAVGGETTGIILNTEKGERYELELGKNEELRKLADELNGKKVVVEGNYKPRKGVEVEERRIIEVESLKSAE